jgi:tRNA U34 5-carboxymethylaminomethyl modifying GTPase MnmE/TrmE
VIKIISKKEFDRLNKLIKVQYEEIKNQMAEARCRDKAIDFLQQTVEKLEAAQEMPIQSIPQDVHQESIRVVQIPSQTIKEPIKREDIIDVLTLFEPVKLVSKHQGFLSGISIERIADALIKYFNRG